MRTAHRKSMLRFVFKIPAAASLRPRWYPRQESNLRARFRKPLLYPLSYGGPQGISDFSPGPYPSAYPLRARSSTSIARAAASVMAPVTCA